MHSPRGIHMIQDASENWHSVNLDGLGSVRNVVDAAGEVISAHNYTPYGVPDSALTGFAFTGEQRDSNGLQYHRARYYVPELGLWASLDPLEMENRYAYVGGNVTNATDRSGLFGELPSDFADCTGTFLDAAAQQGGGVVSPCEVFLAGGLSNLNGQDIRRYLACKSRSDLANRIVTNRDTTNSEPLIFDSYANQSTGNLTIAAAKTLWAWNLAIVNGSTTRVLAGGYALPSGNDVVTHYGNFTFNVLIYPTQADFDAKYPPFAGAPAIYYATYILTNVEALGKSNAPITIMHELVHGYFADTCPSLSDVGGSASSNSVLNEYLAFRATDALQMTTGLPPDNNDVDDLVTQFPDINPFTRSDLEIIRSPLLLAGYPDNLPLYPDSYNATGCSALPKITGS